MFCCSSQLSSLGQKNLRMIHISTFSECQCHSWQLIIMAGAVKNPSGSWILRSAESWLLRFAELRGDGECRHTTPVKSQRTCKSPLSSTSVISLSQSLPVAVMLWVTKASLCSFIDSWQLPKNMKSECYLYSFRGKQWECFRAHSVLTFSIVLHVYQLGHLVWGRTLKGKMKCHAHTLS